MPLGNLTIIDLPSILGFSNSGNSEILLLWSVQKVIWGFQINLYGFHPLEEQVKLIFPTEHV